MKGITPLTQEQINLVKAWFAGNTWTQDATEEVALSDVTIDTYQVGWTLAGVAEQLDLFLSSEHNTSQ